MKGGLGTASLRLGDIVIGALAVVNAAGDVLDWRTDGSWPARAEPTGEGFADIVDVSEAHDRRAGGGRGVIDDPALRSTTLIVVATNLTLTKTQLTKVAMMANCGAARAIRPYHTTGDGDQLFAVSTRRLKRDDVNVTMVGTLAAEVVADAILRGVTTATSVEGWPAAKISERAVRLLTRSCSFRLQAEDDQRTPGGSSRILMLRKWISAPSDSRQRSPFFCVERLTPLTNTPFTASFTTPSTATTS